MKMSFLWSNFFAIFGLRCPVLGRGKLGKNLYLGIELLIHVFSKISSSFLSKLDISTLLSSWKCQHVVVFLMMTAKCHLSQGLSVESVEEVLRKGNKHEDFQSISNQLISTGAIILRTQAMHDLWAKNSKLPYNFCCFIPPNMCTSFNDPMFNHSISEQPYVTFSFSWVTEINFDSFIFNFMKSKRGAFSEALFTMTSLEQSLVPKHANGNWRLVATDFVCRKFTFNASRFESSIVSRTGLNLRNTLYRKVGEICFNSSSDQPNQLVRNCTSDGRRSRNGLREHLQWMTCVHCFSPQISIARLGTNSQS